MNEEQRAVLAAIHHMEGNPGTLIDEYTVARAADILPADLSGNEYLQAAGRERIRRALEELETLGLVRLDREGYWRPRTTLSGRRALQRPLVALPPNRPRLVPTPDAADSGRAVSGAPLAAGAASAGSATAVRGRWPAWWPAALRVGDPSLTPIVAPAVAVLALVLVFIVGVRVLGGGAAEATPSPNVGGAQTATIAAQSPPPTAPPVVPTGAVAPGGASGAPRPVTPTRAAPTPTPANLPPTPTAGPAAARVRVANTENKGANVYVLPAGERRFAIPEGFILEVIGDDQRDTKGQNWKHIRYLDFEGWIPEEYTTPVE